MKSERTWQVISGVSILLLIVVAVVAVLQFYEIRLLRAVGPSPRDPRSSSVQANASTSVLANAEADAQGDQAIAQQVARGIQRYHQDLAAKRAKEAKAVVAAQTKFLLSPDTQRRASEAFRANLKLRYGPLYEALGFSEQEVASFENVMMDRFWVMSDLISAGRLSGVEDVRLADLRSHELEAVDDRIHALLGDDRFRTLRDFDASADARTVVDALAGKIAHSNDPLSGQQIEQLLAVLASAQRSIPNQDDWLKVAVFGRSSAISLNDVDWTKIREDQMGFLSPAQRAIMSAFLADVQQRQAIRDELKGVERQTREALSREVEGE